MYRRGGAVTGRHVTSITSLSLLPAYLPTSHQEMPDKWMLLSYGLQYMDNSQPHRPPRKHKDTMRIVSLPVGYFCVMAAM